MKRTTTYIKHLKTFIKEKLGVNNIKTDITIPDNNIAPTLPIWQTNSDEMPMLFDYDLEKKTRFLIVETLYCDVWRNKWERPKYSYK